MATNVKLLRHQGLILQSPYVHPETKFHFDVAGYGAGKTSGLVYSLVYAVDKLQDKKDAEGNYARIILASKNLTFLSKTSISNLEQILRRTGTDYRYDKKNNIITVGTVDIFLIPLENPEVIYGYSCFEENTKIVTEYGELKIKDVKEGMRVWTTKGWKKVKHVFNNGKKDCIKVTVGSKEILCTPEHRFIDYFNNEIQAKDLTKATTLVKLDTKRWQKWLNTNGKLEKSLKLLTSIVTDITKLHKPAHLIAKTSNVVGQYTVYDLEVEDAHEYFAEGIRVHNCVASFLDELSELPPDVCMEAIKAVNERTRQTVKEFRDPFIVSVSSSQGLDGQYMAMEHFRKNGISYVYIRGETRDNTYLKKSDIDNLYKIYNDVERKVYLEGYFMSVKTRLVFSDYDPVKNKLAVDLYNCLEPDDTVYIGQDFNNFGCAGVACVVKKGAIIVLKDYDIPDIRRAPEIFRYDFPTQKIVWIPDATATSFYTQFKKELWAKNIKISYRKSNPLVQDRVFVINKLMYAERMFICPLAKSVEHSLLTHQFDPKTQQPMKGGKGAPDHISDAMGYAVYHIMCWVKDMKDIYDVTLGRTQISRLGSLGQEIDAGSNLLSAKIKFEVPDNVDNLA